MFLNKVSGAWCPSVGHVMKVLAHGGYLEDLCPKERGLSLLGILERNLSPGTTNPTLKRKEFRTRDLSLGVRYK